MGQQTETDAAKQALLPVGSGSSIGGSQDGAGGGGADGAGMSESVEIGEEYVYPPVSAEGGTIEVNVPDALPSKNSPERMSIAMLLFFSGFICPPLWLLGMLYICPLPHTVCSAFRPEGPRDVKWGKANAAACAVLFVVLLVLVTHAAFAARSTHPNHGR